MRAFSPQSDGTLQADVSLDEALLLQNLASQVSNLLRDGNREDPAIARLLPDAYPDDSAASSEFHRFTAPGLIDRKVMNADVVLATLSSAIESGEVRLDEHEAQAWLKSLTDIRLTIASRLGIETDDQAPSEDTILQDLYDWLGFIQNSLIGAIEHEPHDEASLSKGMDDA